MGCTKIIKSSFFSFSLKNQQHGRSILAARRDSIFFVGMFIVVSWSFLSHLSITWEPIPCYHWLDKYVPLSQLSVLQSDFFPGSSPPMSLSYPMPLPLFSERKVSSQLSHCHPVPLEYSSLLSVLRLCRHGFNITRRPRSLLHCLP